MMKLPKLITQIKPFTPNIEDYFNKIRYMFDVSWFTNHGKFVTEFEQSLMNFGDISTISFHATKLFHNIKGGGISCNKEITKSGDDFIIKIDIIKGSNSRFARVKKIVPNGFDTEENEKYGAIFKFVDNYVKILWTNLPENKSTISIKHKLKKTTTPAGTYNLDEEFSGEFLIVNDVPKTVKIPTGKLTGEGDADIVVENTTENNNTENNNPNTNNEVVNNEVINNNENKTTIVETGNLNITYKIQVLAAHKTVSNNYIKRHYGYSGGIALENHEGWAKYTTGSFGVYKEARDKRNSLNSLDFPNPFITAYNKGERITVQEALMDDWVK